MSRVLSTLTSDEQDDLRCVSTAEAAKVMRVAERTVRAMCERGEIEAVHVGRQWRIRAVVLSEFIRRGSVKNTSAAGASRGADNNEGDR